MREETVSVSALVKRINRRLAPQDRRVCKTRNYEMQSDFGEYHLVDTRRNMLLDSSIDGGQDLMDLAKELGCLRVGEIVVGRRYWRDLDMYGDPDGIVVWLDFKCDIVGPEHPGKKYKVRGHRLYACSAEEAQQLIRADYLRRF